MFEGIASRVRIAPGQGCADKGEGCKHRVADMVAGIGARGEGEGSSTECYRWGVSYGSGE